MIIENKISENDEVARNLHIDVLHQLKREEDLSIRNTTFSILREAKTQNLSDSQKAKRISDAIIALRKKFDTVRGLILKNHKNNPF